MSAFKKTLAILLITANLSLFTVPTQAAGQDLTSALFNYFIHGQTSIEGALTHTVFCMLVGWSPYNQCAAYAMDGTTKIGLASPVKEPKIVLYDHIPSGGAVGGLTSTMVAFYDNPPTSSTLYLADLGQNLGIIPQPAYAQVMGSGEKIINPIFKLWQASRNLAYFAFTLVFVVVGLMIMLRQKINPQTVVSAQQALPSLVIGLVLVTFSYFIAALIIDLAFVGMQMVAQLFILSGIHSSLGDVQQLAKDANAFQLFQSTGLNGTNMSTGFNGVKDQLSTIFTSAGGGNPAMAWFLPALIGGIAGGLMLGGLGGAAGVAIGGGSTIIIPALVILVLLIALVIQLFRLLFALLTTYIQILVFAIGGPFFILIGSIPGRGGVITMWWKGLLANTLVFPAVFAIFLFAGTIMSPDLATAWGNSTLPLFGNISGDFIRTLLAFGIVLAVPSVPDMVRAALGVKGPQGFAQAALGGFMGGVGVAQTGYGRWTAGPAAIQKAWQDADAKAKAGVGPAAPQGPPRRFPWIY
jgi:hypothetical protein